MRRMRSAAFVGKLQSTKTRKHIFASPLLYVTFAVTKMAVAV